MERWSAVAGRRHRAGRFRLRNRPAPASRSSRAPDRSTCRRGHVRGGGALQRAWLPPHLLVPPAPLLAYGRGRTRIPRRPHGEMAAAPARCAGAERGRRRDGARHRVRRARKRRAHNRPANERAGAAGLRPRPPGGTTAADSWMGRRTNLLLLLTRPQFSARGRVDRLEPLGGGGGGWGGPPWGASARGRGGGPPPCFGWVQAG